MRQKREKAVAELEEFFNRCSSDSESENEKHNSILERRPKQNVYREGKKVKRHNQLTALDIKDVSIAENKTVVQKKPKIRQKISLADYNITHTIGKGASAVVKLGTHIENKQNVVFKIYDKEQLKKSHRMKALQDEIKLMKKIDHPNIVKLYDVIEDDKSIMLALEYIQGGSLKEYLKKKSNHKISEAEACAHFGQIVDAVRYLHLKKIYHRDLKLENILLDYKKDIKIIDFGYSAT